MSPHLSIPESLWNTVPPEAQAAILAVIASLEKRIADLEAKLNLNSTNSSRPPSTDPPAVKLKRRPPAPPSGRKRGGQPGHKRHTRALVPAEQLRGTFDSGSHPLGTRFESDLREEVTHATAVERSPRAHPQGHRQPRGLPKEARRTVLRQSLDDHPAAPTPPSDRLVRAQAPCRRRHTHPR